VREFTELVQVRAQAWRARTDFACWNNVVAWVGAVHYGENYFISLISTTSLQLWEANC